VTAEPHDVWLTWTGEVNQSVEEARFLGLDPVGPMFTQKTSDDLVRPKSKGVSCAVTPSKIHSISFDIDAPSIVDVQADVDQKVSHGCYLDLARCQETRIGEKGHVLWCA
jgi:hypothetical protein